MRVAIIPIACVLLLSCATSPLSTEQTTLVPPERVFDTTYLTPAENRKGLVIVKRDSPRLGVDCDNLLFVNGQKVAAVEPRERIELYLGTEEQILSVTKPTCGGELKEMTVVPSETVSKTFRIWSNAGGRLRFERTAF